MNEKVPLKVCPLVSLVDEKATDIEENVLITVSAAAVERVVDVVVVVAQVVVVVLVVGVEEALVDVEVLELVDVLTRGVVVLWLVTELDVDGAVVVTWVVGVVVVDEVGVVTTKYTAIPATAMTTMMITANTAVAIARLVCLNREPLGLLSI